MNFVFEERLSDSALVERVWRTHSDYAGSFASLAETHSEMVVMKRQGKTLITMRGPETKASLADCPADAEFFGIVLKLGAFMPGLPAVDLLNRNDATLPQVSPSAFWLDGSAWQFPTFDNADTFVGRLARQGLLVRDPVVEAVLQGRPQDLSIRSVRRHFLHATGLTSTEIHQIERARHALALLQQGSSIFDAVDEAGYFDQPHLTRSLKRFTGQTPAQIVSARSPEPMSLLYKTGSQNLGYDLAV